MKILFILAIIFSTSTVYGNDVKVSISDLVSGEVDIFYIDDFSNLPDLLNQVKGYSLDDINLNYDETTSGLSTQVNSLRIRAMRIGGNEGGND